MGFIWLGLPSIYGSSHDFRSLLLLDCRNFVFFVLGFLCSRIGFTEHYGVSRSASESWIHAYLRGEVGFGFVR